jgi:uncharacterized phage protein (TIGR02220 family)
MKNILIPVEFLKAIGEKHHHIRIYWMKWLADYTDHLFKPDFVELFINDMEGKNINIETIKEAYEFGMVFFKDGFKFTDDKKEKRYSDSNIELITKVIEYLNSKSSSSYTLSETNKACILSRIKEGYTISDFQRVIDLKCSQWLGTSQQKYLRPITLFQTSKFENYLNEPINEIKENGTVKKSTNLEKLSNASKKAREYFN